MRRLAQISALWLSLAFGASGLVFSFIPIDFPGASGTVPTAVNARNDIVGAYSDGSTNHAFLLKGGKFRRIDFPGSISNLAHGVNARGEIVGSYLDSAAG
jgi:hypothetical protein